MTGGQMTINGVVTSNISIICFFKTSRFNTLLKWRGILKDWSSARSSHLLLMTLYLTSSCLNFLSPASGVNYRAHRLSRAKLHFFHYHRLFHSPPLICSIYTTQHMCKDISLSVCHFCVCARSFVGRFQTSRAHGFPEESLRVLTMCTMLGATLWMPVFVLRAKVTLQASHKVTEQIVNTKHIQG